MSNRELTTFVVVIIAIICVLNFVFGWIGKASQYADGLTEKQMVACQAAGKTYGECFNVIQQRQTIKFQI